MTVGEMLRRMDGPELDRWRQLYVQEGKLAYGGDAPDAGEEPDDDDDRIWDLLLRH